jgi:hypothetical protein
MKTIKMEITYRMLLLFINERAMLSGNDIVKQGRPETAGVQHIGLRWGALRAGDRIETLLQKAIMKTCVRATCQ